MGYDVGDCVRHEDRPTGSAARAHDRTRPAGRCRVVAGRRGAARAGRGAHDEGRMNELARAVLVTLGLLAPQPAMNAGTDSPLVLATPVAVPMVPQEPAPGPPADAWLGEDKFRHFWAS